MQRNICQICGKDMSESGEVLYSRIYDTPEINEGRYIQRIGCCDNCGFVTVLNPLGDTEMDKHYSSGYDYTNYSSLEIEKDNYIERANKAVKLFDALRLEYDSVLDIGASTGYFLSLFNGKKVYGVETSDSGVYTAKQRYNIELYHGQFQEFVMKSGKSYDLIIMMHILEHIDNLDIWMKDLKKSASRYVYVEVPCLFTSPVEPFGLFAEEHLNYFTPASLESLFVKYGFSCIHMSIEYMVNYRIANGFPMIRAIFEKNGGGEERQTRIHEMIGSHVFLDNYFSWSRSTSSEILDKLKKIIHSDDSVAIWGASFQTERLLGENDYSWMSLDCILDNSDMRCRYSLSYNGKLIPVRKPDKDILDKVDHIIISTYNNQEAIYRQIKDMGYESKAIILYDPLMIG